jgi:hypothetical protein
MGINLGSVSSANRTSGATVQTPIMLLDLDQTLVFLQKNLLHGGHHLHFDPASPLNQYRGEPVNPLPAPTSMRSAAPQAAPSGCPPSQVVLSGRPPPPAFT